MALVFLATQGSNSRQNETGAASHRSRLSGPKRRASKVHPGLYSDQTLYASNPEAETLYTPLQYAQDPSAPSDPEEFYSNNNNESLYDFNRSSQADSCDFEKENYLDGVIEWPLEHTIKSRRLSQVRKQVKNLSSAIKRSIDPDTEGMANAVYQPHVRPDWMGQHNVTFKEPKIANIEQLVPVINIPRKHKEVKQMLRENHWDLGHPIRKELWQTLIQCHSTETCDPNFYWDLVESNYGVTDLSRTCLNLPGFVHRGHRNAYGLTTEGIRKCERVLGVLNFHNPAITYAPSLFCIVALLLHYMDEPTAFHCISILTNSRKKSFIPQSKVKYVATFRAFQHLCKKHARGSYSDFKNSSAGQTNCFMNWMFWIFEALPLINIVRIMDCFVFEGHKALMRAGIALFDKWMHNKPLNNPFLTTLGPFTQHTPYLEVKPDGADKMMKVAYSIRGLTEKEIRKLIKENEAFANKTGVETLMEATTPVEEPEMEDPSFFMPEDISGTNELYTMFKLLKSANLAERKLQLVYTTREDGNTLTSFYRKVEDYNELFLVVKENDESLFGAYLSAPLRTRNLRDEHGNVPRYFGTGESFLFQLRPKLSVYPWVVAKMQQENRFLSNYENTMAQFIYAGQEMLCIGGGGGQGLMLDHDFENGKSEPCNTFNNKQLSQKEDFKIMAVEAYCLSRTD